MNAFIQALGFRVCVATEDVREKGTARPEFSREAAPE
jgi:hypothetical protein